MHVAQEREGQRVALLELGMRERRVAADPEHDGAHGLQLLGDPAEVAELGRSDASPVVAVEEQHDVGHTLELRQRHLAAARGRKGEGGRLVAIAQHGHCSQRCLNCTATILS